jgi:hypothetical protein
MASDSNKKMLAMVLLWLLAINFIAVFTWGFGPTTFIGLLVLVASQVWLTSRDVQCNALPVLKLKFLQGFVVFFIVFNIVCLYIGSTIRPDYLVDIAENTYLAASHLLSGDNPYSHYAQVFVNDFSNAANTEVVGDKVFILGYEYRFGYPYFPVMAYAYLPSVAIFDSFTSIRLTNFILLMLQLMALYGLTKKLIHNEYQKQGFYLSSFLLLGIFMLPVELYYYAITDIVIATLLLYCFLALSYKKYVLAAILLGLAQSCKLLPAPFIALILLVMYWGRPFLLKSVMAYLLTMLLMLGPFLLADWQSFLASTTLFYLSYHQAGDNSSLWFFLPPALQTLFTYLGPLLAVASVLYFKRQQPNLLLASLSAAFSSYAIFMAFSKMTHLNYLWAVYPLGCLALVLLLMPKKYLYEMA